MIFNIMDTDTCAKSQRNFCESHNDIQVTLLFKGFPSVFLSKTQMIGFKYLLFETVDQAVV